jgi:hypothetical protein
VVVTEDIVVRLVPVIQEVLHDQISTAQAQSPHAGVPPITTSNGVAT